MEQLIKNLFIIEQDFDKYCTKFIRCMKDETAQDNGYKLFKRIVLLNCCVLFVTQLSAQFNEFTIPAELIKANRVRSIKQEYTSGRNWKAEQAKSRKRG